MTWNGKAMQQALAPIAKNIGRGFSVVAESEARPLNSYICNNTSYVILHLLKGYSAKLAGGLLVIRNSHNTARAGFFHYPVTSSIDSESVWGWATGIASAFRAELP